MNIENLNADQFQNSMALLADVAEEALKGELGTRFKAAIADYRTKAKASGDEVEVTGLALDTMGELVPVLLREGGELSYKLLAALDGQTLDEYKGCFTVRKYAADIKAAVDGAATLKEIVAPFLS